MRVTSDENLIKAAIALKRNCRLKENCAEKGCIFYDRSGYNRCKLDDVSPEYWRVGDDQFINIHRDNDRKAQPQTFFLNFFYIEFNLGDGKRHFYCGEVRTDENGLKKAELGEGNPYTYGEPFLFKTDTEAREKAEELIRTCKNLPETFFIRDIVKEVRFVEK